MDRRATQGVEASLRRLLRRLEEAIHPSRIILFGSRARGDNLIQSDVDLVIVSKAFEGVGWRERILKVLELWDGDVPLEPLCYTPEEFESRSQEISIVREAVRGGVVLLPQ
ncbi:MAG: nucleotidyltransferase domain-containing protein [Thermoplasmata archaeon]